ncbi:hypothetical protein [Lewinella sp. W8]|uniref:hypothetical protein n=1 Tax=Lewinella sp. W8 TaxID=2528208 RepID=UPI00156713DB|nr:hypothetical protein [Lewinella sp. W8]
MLSRFFIARNFICLTAALLLLLAVQPLTAQDTISFGGVYELPEAEVRATYVPVSPLAQRFTVEEVYRLPGTFYDPARLVALLPGVVQTNDQANHLSVRGNTPNANLWRINGLAIANPNHTSNAGTIGDTPTFNGGGVNAISAQMLEAGNFYAGGLPVEYSAAPGGTFDLRLRPGNKDRMRYQAQLGFIGLDLAAEGPIGKGGRTSFLANGRYSFTGLLADMGVDFGGEEIRFGDLNFHLHHKTDRGSISFFSILGSSSNIFRQPEDEPLESEKGLYDIDFTGSNVINGLQFTHQLGDRWTVTGGAALSDIVGERLVTGQGPGNPQDVRLEFFQSDLQLKASYALNGEAALTFGLNRLAQEVSRKSTASYAFFGGYRLRSAATEVEAGLRLSSISFENVRLADDWTNILFEPRFSIKRNLGNRYVQAILEGTVAAPIFTHLVDGEANAPTTWQLALGYGYPLLGATVSTTGFVQYTPNENSAEGTMVASNLLEYTSFTFTNSQEIATLRYGVEVEAAGGRLTRGLYYRANASVFRSLFDRNRTGMVEGRFDLGFTGNLTLGREWRGTNRKEEERALGLNLAVTAHGGERFAALTTDASYFRGTSLAGPFINDGSVYLRPDLRLYKRVEGKRATTTLALDIQNVANIENDGFAYYDSVLETFDNRFQLGMIPVLSYRIVWR